MQAHHKMMQHPAGVDANGGVQGAGGDPNIAAKNGLANQSAEKIPVPCKFEELKDDFLIQREIGRGKKQLTYFLLLFVW